MSRVKKRPKQRLSGGCAIGAYLAFNATYLVSTATYCCKLSFNVFLMGQDHGDISLAGVWLHKERFLRTSAIVTGVTMKHQAGSRVQRTCLAASPASGSRPAAASAAGRCTPQTAHG